HHEDDPRVHGREGRDRLSERGGLKDDRGAEQQQGAGPPVGQEAVQKRPLLRRVPERRPAVALDRLGRIGRRRPPRRRLLGGRLAGRGLWRFLLLHAAHFTTAAETWSMKPRDRAVAPERSRPAVSPVTVPSRDGGTPPPHGLTG